MSYRHPELLGEHHELDGFVCSSHEQTLWLREHARNASRLGTAKVQVVTNQEGPDVVVAYYGWTMASLHIKSVPKPLRAGAGRYPQPVALLARLGVHTDHAGVGLGAALLSDVVHRTATIASKIGCRGLLVHCENDEAKSFYLHNADFLESPTDPLHLVLPINDILAAVQHGDGV